MNKFAKFSPILLILSFLLIGSLIFYTYTVWRRANSPIIKSNTKTDSSREVKTGILREVNVTPGQFGEGYKEIIPGLSTKKDAIFKLGSKYESKTKDAYEHLIYKYDLSGRSDIEGDVVVSINEKGVVERLNHRAELKSDGTDVSYWLQRYGGPEVLTYSNYLKGVFEYVYPSRGVWLRVRGSIIFTWFYFQPMSSKIFLETIGNDLPLVNPHQDIL